MAERGALAAGPNGGEVGATGDPRLRDREPVPREAEADLERRISFGPGQAAHQGVGPGEVRGGAGETIRRKGVEWSHPSAGANGALGDRSAQVHIRASRIEVRAEPEVVDGASSYLRARDAKISLAVCDAQLRSAGFDIQIQVESARGECREQAPRVEVADGAAQHVIGGNVGADESRALEIRPCSAQSRVGRAERAPAIRFDLRLQQQLTFGRHREAERGHVLESERRGREAAGELVNRSRIVESARHYGVPRETTPG